MNDYKKVFEVFEHRLLEYGSLHKERSSIQNELNKYKSFESRELSDNEYYEILIFVAFYSGFKAATVTSKSDVIKKHFPSLEVVADYGDTEIKAILNDPNMIKNKNKIAACVKNSKTFKKIIGQFGSFKSYIESFSARDSFENLILLKEELEARFSYLGRITVYHFLTDIGMPILKPDRVICRIFECLGLIENSGQLLKTIIHGRKFAEVTKLPIRYIDIIFVAYGQAASSEFGIDKGICLKEPRCEICDARSFCKDYGLRNKSSRLINSPLI